MWQIVTYLLMVQNVTNLNQKILKLQQIQYVFILLIQDWSVDNLKRTGFNYYVYDFSVNYDAILVDDTKDVHKILMKKNNIV